MQNAIKKRNPAARKGGNEKSPILITSHVELQIKQRVINAITGIYL